MTKSRLSKRAQPPRILEYELPGGWRVLVGRTDADNEALRLSLRIASPNDWWFHVRGMPGSHAVLQARTDTEPSRDVLKRVASIAAYHSKAREGGLVSVSCTRVRDVSKPRGSAVGTVQIRHEMVLKVRPSLEEATNVTKSTSA
jgi:predicted ribosome quality control (RQC) complex YloA/Tae2 family protein